MKPTDPRQPKPSHDDEHIRFFLPGQAVFHLEHEAGVSPRQLEAALAGFLKDPPAELVTQYPLRFLPPKAGEFVTIRPRTAQLGRAISIVQVKQAEALGQDALVGQIVALFDLLSKRDRGYPIGPGGSDAITLKTATPNWLMGAVYHQIVTGGPGGWPREASVPDGVLPAFQLTDKQGLLPANQGLGVHVAILDTSPPLHDLIYAHEDLPGHALVQTLLAEDGPLHVIPATYEELRLIGDFSLAGHRHYMPDHGLFVAGIINTLAPKAELHLFEVLNPYGVGCVLTIVKGLLQALDLPRPLIVNCSLVLDLPEKGEEEPDFPPEFIQNEQLMEYLQRPLQDAFELLVQEGAVVVAAAGNDAHPGPGLGPESTRVRPKARVPARFQNVIGVGALPKGKPGRGQSPQAASYSNLADDPTDKGYVVFGGEDAPNQGMVGIYLNPYPQYQDPIPADRKKVKAERFKYIPNQTGWAEWAGTSFATPVLSGLLAVKWSENPNQTTSFARTFLDSLVSDNTDNFNERAIFVEQTL